MTIAVGFGPRRRTRTSTGVATPHILSLVRLPVPPSGETRPVLVNLVGGENATDLVQALFPERPSKTEAAADLRCTGATGSGTVRQGGQIDGDDGGDSGNEAPDPV